MGNACVFCDDEWPYRDPLHEDDLWSLRGLDGPPGWTVLWLRRHAEGVTELTSGELASLGPSIARVTAAITEASGAPKVYVNVYGEAHVHFHVVLIARGPEVPNELRGPAMLPNAVRLPRDDERAQQVADAIRDHLSRPSA